MVRLIAYLQSLLSLLPLFFAALLPLSPLAVTAWTIDDFSAKQIDPGRWETAGTPGLFFFSGSNPGVRFLSSEGKGERLVTKSSFGSGLFRLRFRDFHSDNKEPSGQSRGSFVALGLGPPDRFVRVIRGAIRSGGYFEKNSITDSLFRKGISTMDWVPTEATEGGLELYYDGKTVRAYFQSGMPGNNRWREIGSPVKPAWMSPPHLFISGFPGPDRYCGTTSFAIDAVEYWPIDDKALPSHEPPLRLPIH